MSTHSRRIRFTFTLALGGALLAPIAALGVPGAAPPNLLYVPLAPCRVIDTRVAGAGGPLIHGVVRKFFFRGPTRNYATAPNQGGNSAGCGIPDLSALATPGNLAKAVAINIIAVNAAGFGDMRAWPANQSAPLASVVNYATVPGPLNIANGIILTMCDEASATPCATGDISFLAEFNNTDLVVDVVGYFTEGGTLGDNTNLALGHAALTANTAGSNNTAAGFEALQGNTTGSGNVALGAAAGGLLTTGSDNIDIGNTGSPAESGTIRIGTSGTHSQAFIAGIAGTPVTGSLLAVTAGGQLGTTSAPSPGGAAGGDLSGTFPNPGVAAVGGVTAANVATGANAANASTDLDTASAIVRRDGSGSFSAGTVSLAGDLALPATAGAGVGVITLNALPFLHSFGSHSTFLGEGAGNFTLSGNANTGIGRIALTASTTGFNNTAIGSSALKSDTTGHSNTATGAGALAFNIGGAASAGSFNTASGAFAMYNNSTGKGNTASGFSALANNTTGDSNTALGDQALYYNTTAKNNTALGFMALSTNNLGEKNTASGSLALLSNTTGSSNTAAGYTALTLNLTGSNNTASGRNALENNTVGSGNTASGFNALQNTTGSRNIGLGYAAGAFLTTGSDNIHIGNMGVAAETATIKIGASGTQTQTFIAGIRGATTGVADAVAVMIDSNGQLGTISSSRRFKEDIHDMAGASERIFDLRPVTFRYRPEVQPGTRPLEYGLIAEEVEQAFPELVVYDQDGQPQTVKYHLLVPLLLNELQRERGERRDEVARLEREIRARADESEAQRRELARQRQALAELLHRVEASQNRGHAAAPR